MKVSVSVATYNGERFLADQLDTLRSQLQEPDEVVITDDGSADGTCAEASAYIARFHPDDSWKLIRNEENKGYARNFLENCVAATGDVVFFCDQDDLWETDKIRTMVKTLEEHPEIDLLASNLRPFYEEEGARQFDDKVLAEMKDDGSVDRFNTANGFHLKRSGCTMCFRHSFLDEVMPYWEPGWAHDEFLWKMACVTDSCAILQRFTTNRRMHSGNATNIKKRTRDWRLRQLDDMARWNASLKRYAQDKRLDPEGMSRIEKFDEALALRKKLLTKRNPFLWLKLWRRYADCYPRKKGLYLDLYLVFFKESHRN